jgi:hypothetical protein
MTNADRYGLLHGPYTALPLKPGDRATCFFRDGDVIITGWSNGHIPWPRCRLPGTPAAARGSWLIPSWREQSAPSQFLLFGSGGALAQRWSGVGGAHSAWAESTELPAVAERVETSAVQFGDDWPVAG